MFMEEMFEFSKEHYWIRLRTGVEGQTSVSAIKTLHIGFYHHDSCYGLQKMF